MTEIISQGGATKVTERCKHGNTAPPDSLQNLPFSQAGPERHKCVVCAFNYGYEAGLQESISKISKPVYSYSCGHGNNAPLTIIDDLPESQGGTGRHRCAVCAFSKGFEIGFRGGQKKFPLGIKQLSHKGKLKLVEAPKKVIIGEKYEHIPSPRKMDYLTVSVVRQLIGDLGELLVLSYEREKLININRTDLSDRVRHVSAVDGDGAGYDILSFSPEGEKKYIEVKTTLGDIYTPFYLSINELNFSKNHPYNFFLYRLFNFNKTANEAEFYMVPGNLDLEFTLIPLLFRAWRK